MNVAATRSRSIHRAYLAAGLAATALYFALPWDSFAQTLVYDAIGASAAAVSILGSRIHRPSLRLPWYLFGAGLLAFSVGDVFFNLYSFVWHRDPPVPSIADVFYLAGYPLLTAGLCLLVRRLRSEERRRGRFDAAMLIAAFALCQWIFLMQDRLHSGSLGERVVALSYPAMDVILLAALVFFALTPTSRTVAYRYLAVSIVFLLVADEVYGLSPARYAHTTWLDSFWLLSYVCWGVAALHPSMRELSEPARAHAPRVSTLRLAMLAVALTTAPAVLLIQSATGASVDAVPIAVGAGLLGGLVLLRLTSIIHALEELRGTERLARAEAETAQRLLAEQNERLREADRLKDEFVALISHDLRTPLTSITGYVELALEDDLTDDVRGFLQVVARNADRLLALVNDLLFVARLQAGEMSLEPADVDLAGVVRDGVNAMEPRAAAKGITLTCVLDAVPSVHADRNRMLQVVDNLVSNALKFTPEGGAVHVSLRQHDDCVRLEVTDSGIGIAPNDQRRLFQRFFRAENAVERQVPGTGLGLYISRVIAEAHDGSVSVRSELGRGSTFRLELPMARAAVAA
ncbi:MAG: HAMP domain-containing histidine kinase [Actinobacteria bacterium]|nr:MAG: HAMP domain-containing histidine kinase [Actinomycetota bacterium]